MSVRKNKSLPGNTKAAVRRLALGSPADAVRLLLFGEDMKPDEISELDLFGVSAIKRSGSGVSEIKFYDRLKAIQYLDSVGGKKSGGANGLIEALISAAKED